MEPSIEITPELLAGFIDEADEYLSMTQWASKQDFVAWTKSDAFKKAHSGPRAKGVIGAQPAGYEVVVERGVEA